MPVVKIAANAVITFIVLLSIILNLIAKLFDNEAVSSLAQGEIKSKCLLKAIQSKRINH